MVRKKIFGSAEITYLDVVKPELQAQQGLRSELWI